MVPIHKKGDKCDVNNYRPISLTSLVVKVMEVCIREKLYDKCINLIKNKQHGLQPGKSCTTQMIPYIDDIMQILNSRNDVDIIYFDFAKAFDSVNHDIILEKLKHKYSIDGLMLNFIKIYLKDRYQRVVVGGTFSRTLPVNSGVLQGSILGPLLFVLFIDDIYESISEGTHMALYADDTKIWCKISSYSDCIILNNDIASLSEWACRNKMKFHPSKCKVLSSSLRHTKFYILPFDRFAYELGENVLDYCDEETDLGIVMTPKISWESQHSTILMKATRQIGLLTRTCHFIKNQSQKRALYITLVRSLFEHCGEIWAPNAVVAHKKFETIQKRAVKWILCESNFRYSEYDYLKKLKTLDLLPMQQFFELKKLKLFNRIRLNNIAIGMPHYIIHHRLAHSNGNQNKLAMTLTANLTQPIVRPFGNSFFPSSIAL